MSDLRTQMERTAIDFDELDLAHLVGQTIHVYSRQFPGRPLDARVISNESGIVLVNHGEASSLLANLVNQQWVVIRFPYKGEVLSATAQLRKGGGGRCYFAFKPEATPLTRRKYFRVELTRPVRLATINLRSFGRQRLQSLRWLETETINISSGGALIAIPSVLESGITMLLNIDLKKPSLPPLVLGEVCHSFQHVDARFRTGVRFMVTEEATRRLAPSLLNRVPRNALSYNSGQRDKLNKEFQTIYSL